MELRVERPLVSLRRRVGALYRLVVTVVAMPVILAEYFSGETGSEYGVGPAKKGLLAWKMLRNHGRIPTGSTFLEHLVIATKLLNTPPEVAGRIVECGCYKGGSTANLSLVAALCDRRLEVFDSFAGMPEPESRDRAHVRLASGQVHTYSAGAWRASLDEVRDNVARYGDASVCRFNVGYFDETLPAFDEPCALIFLDVGLRDSAETCLAHLWPLLRDGCYLFVHDIQHMEMATLFFDAEWWTEHADGPPPGVVGAGDGLGLHPGPNGFGSMLGYTVKNPPTTDFEQIPQIGVGLDRPS